MLSGTSRTVGGEVSKPSLSITNNFNGIFADDKLAVGEWISDTQQEWYAHGGAEPAVTN
jgi:hypothetical protein